MFNLSGSEIVFLLLMALVILGPDRLPDAMRRAGKAYSEFKKVTTGFQTEMRSALEEPLRELRETADLAKNAATFDLNLPSMSNVTPTPRPSAKVAAASATPSFNSTPPAEVVVAPRAEAVMNSASSNPFSPPAGVAHPAPFAAPLAPPAIGSVIIPGDVAALVTPTPQVPDA